ncbi:hypothetical protein [Paraburkholderia phenazinium]|uniref:Uncharacterized protein n=1 Tax=Paraburkholderia phenazinium TaxID=60549 RepID=A0A1N6KPH0_9BURK|nr:hypothetical protein [Paraburkholderia phenazinium]SIO58439.1 hypothetical protein SAMN05444165_4145 [Paraburkholderia phenazinium]
MNQTYLKYAAAAALFVLWALLDYLFKQDPADLISSIKWALGALGAYHTITNLQGPQQQVPLAVLMQMLQQFAPQQPAKPGLPTVPLKEAP